MALVTASCVRRTACCQVEAEVLFEALTDRVVRFDIAGEPERRLNNTLRSIGRCP